MADENSRIYGKSTGNEVGYGKPPAEHQFAKGNAGRPEGSRNKLGEAFLRAMCDDFDIHGVAAIEAVRIEKPEAYLRVIASILPQETAVAITHRFVARMPAPAESVEEWLTQHSQKSLIQ